MDWYKALQALLDTLGGIGSAIWSAISSFFGGLGDVISTLFSYQNLTIDKFREIRDDVETLVKNIEVEIERTKRFTFDPKWSSRVINVPIAIDQSRALIELVTHDLVEKVKTIIEPLRELALIEKAEETAGATNPLDQPSRITKATVTVGHINTAVGQISTAIKAAQSVVDIFDKVRDNLEHLDVLFLQQGNPRQKASQKTQRRPR